ncbi:MAG: flavodoxin family protein [candidate division Zixibacteria bacterium]
MIKILSISGSPVVDSSTDILLDLIAQSLKSAFANTDKVEVNKVRLNDLMFLPCQACGKTPAPNFCFFDDALTDVYKLLAECDCLLVGSPIYFDAVSAQLKAFMDRCNCFRPPDYKNQQEEFRFIKIIKEKRPGAIVLVGDNDGWIEGPRRSIVGFLKWVEVTSEGLVWYRSLDFNKKGTVASDSKTLEEARQLGQKLGQLLNDKK